MPETSTLPVYLIHRDAPRWCASAARSLGASSGIRPLLSVVDNGQRGGEPLAALLPDHVRIIPTGRNLGYAGAANRALADWRARFPDAEFCVIASHDLHAENDTLGHLVAAARHNTGYGVLGPGITAPVPSSGGRWTGLAGAQEPLGGAVGLVERDWVSGTCMLIRRGCADALGGFDARLGSYCEDVDFCLRAGDAGWRVGVLTDALAWGLGSATPDAWARIEANTVRLVAKRHGGRAGIRAFGRLLSWLARAAGGACAAWRASHRRAASRAFFGRHARAVVLVLAGARWWRRVTPPAGPLVSVVVPTRNRRALLEKTVASVLAQTLASLELIVVDDASDDTTWQWLSAVSDSRVVALRQPELAERSAARNLALERARGAFVLFLDDDDLLAPRALERLAGALRADPRAAVAVGGIHAFGDGDLRCGWGPWVRRVWSGPLWCQFDALDGAITGRMLWRRAALERAGPFDPDRVPCEDLDVIARLLRAEPETRAVFVPGTVMWLRLHPDQSRWGMAVNARWSAAAEQVRSDRAALRRTHPGWRRLDVALGRYGQAAGAYNRGAAGACLRDLGSAIATEPRLLRWPLWRAQVVRLGAKALLPRGLRGPLRHAKGQVLARRGARGWRRLAGASRVRAHRGLQRSA